MSTTTPSALVSAYTCNHCRKTLTLNGPVLIGQSRLPDVAQMLAEHLGQEHQKLLAALAIQGQRVTGWLVAEQFKHNDAEFAKVSNDVRLEFRRAATRPEDERVSHVSDETIERQVDTHMGTDFDPDDRRDVIRLLKGLRDTLEASKEPPPPAT